MRIWGTLRVLVWNWVRMTQSRVRVIGMDEITGLMFASHCFMLGNDRMLFWHVLVCELGKVGGIVCVIRVGTLQVSPKRVHLA